MPAHSRKRISSDVEWVGGIATLPSYVTGEGEPFRPEVLFWMAPDGMILGSETARPGELMSMACESLRQTIRQPMAGPPSRPHRVRVASPELAAVLRDGQGAVKVVCAPTPELDALIGRLQETFGRDDAGPQTYLSPGVTPEAVAAFFQAAAALYRRAPWTVVPDDQALIGVDVEVLDIRGAVVSVIGQMGESFGFVCFDSLVDFHEYVEAAPLFERGEAPELPPHFAVNFERGADLAPGLRKEISTHGWEVAGADAYPWLVAIDGDLVGRPLTLRELILAEAICRALVQMLDEHGSAVDTAWEGGDVFAETFTVATATQPMAVTLTTPIALSDCGMFNLEDESFLPSDGADQGGASADGSKKKDKKRKASTQARRRNR